MQKEIGSVMALYPTPLTLVGTVVDGRVNWLPIAHVGVVEHQAFVISVDNAHELSNRGIKENNTVSVSLVREEMLKAVDYCGIKKGAEVDKSGVFEYRFGDLEGAPIPVEAPLTMECEVISSFEVGNFTNYVVKSKHTHVQEEYLNERGKVDYEAMSPVLFEFQNAQYLSTGSVLGACWRMGRDYDQEEK